ncbi:hypothetical protein EIP91_010943 [Steccherinum ochraceum]|uniref:Uncharacterized protein n=1 Tax=Steccherinum ochraceum TaxID=92696 RepID=A0A4R0R272_9APHY|nr:hypothetical protein EIP91_010943 [Steccherinum ochraceum]
MRLAAAFIALIAVASTVVLAAPLRALACARGDSLSLTVRDVIRVETLNLNELEKRGGNGWGGARPGAGVKANREPLPDDPEQAAKVQKENARKEAERLRGQRRRLADARARQATAANAPPPMSQAGSRASSASPGPGPGPGHASPDPAPPPPGSSRPPPLSSPHPPPVSSRPLPLSSPHHPPGSPSPPPGSPPPRPESPPTGQDFMIHDPAIVDPIRHLQEQRPSW